MRTSDGFSRRPYPGTRRPVTRRHVAALLVTAGLALAPLAVTAPAAPAHIVNSSGGITHDLYYPSGATDRCVYDTGNCSLHSFTFSSANDLADVSGFFCAAIYYPWSPPYDVVEETCGGYAQIPRECLNNGHDGGGPLHCSDQDHTQYKAGAANGFSGTPTTLRRHIIY
jgi:hypothetical protein